MNVSPIGQVAVKFWLFITPSELTICLDALFENNNATPAMNGKNDKTSKKIPIPRTPFGTVFITQLYHDQREVKYCQ